LVVGFWVVVVVVVVVPVAVVVVVTDLDEKLWKPSYCCYCTAVVITM